MMPGPDPIPRRPQAPPPLSFFDAPRPPFGERRVALRLGPLELELSGLDDALAATLERRYAPYADSGARGPDALRVRVGREDRRYFIDPPRRPELNPVRIACEGDRVRYLGYRVAGWFDAVGTAGAALLADGDYEPPERALENYVRAAVAWRAACAGGALVHGASAVRDGAAYLFFGPSGAGKSTLSACDRRGTVVSDDLSLLLPDGRGKLELIGSPFRGTYEGGAPVTGAFPLRAGFRLVQAERAAVVDVGRIRVLGELVANLPFVAEAFRDRPDLFARVEDAFRGVPLAHLRFRKDDSYWDALRAAGY